MATRDAIQRGLENVIKENTEAVTRLANLVDELISKVDGIDAAIVDLQKSAESKVKPSPLGDVKKAATK